MTDIIRHPMRSPMRSPVSTFNALIGGLTPTFYAPLTSNLFDNASNTFGTFTRASTATYTPVGASVIHSAAINTARFETNGLLLEPVGTNYAINSHGEANNGTTYNSWGFDIGTKSLTSATDVFDSTDFPNAKWQRIQYTFVGGEDFNNYLMSQNTGAGSFEQGDIVTISLCIKGSTNFTASKHLYINVNVNDSDNAFLEVVYSSSVIFDNITSEEQFVSFTFTLTHADTSRIVPYIGKVKNADVPLAGDTCDISITKLQIEKSPVATSYKPTIAATATRATEEGNTYWPFASLDPAVLSSLSGVGTLLCQVTFGNDYDEYSAANSNIVTSNVVNASVLYLNSITGLLRSYDGSNVISEPFQYLKNTTYKCLLQWGYQNSGEKFRVGYYDTSITSTEGNFDGGYINNVDLILGYTLAGPTHIKNLVFYNRKLTDSEIANYFNSL